MTALANQLRLVRDAVAKMAAESGAPAAAADYQAIKVVLAELIAEDVVPPMSATEDRFAAQMDRINAVQAVALLERAVPVQASKNDAATNAPTDGEIDPKAVEAYLNHAIAGEGQIKVLDMRTVAQGMSKKTVIVTLSGNKVLPEEIALRVDRTANNYLGTTVVDEFPALNLLWNNHVTMPQPFALEPTGKVIGDPFIVFARAQGADVAGGDYVSPPHNPALLDDIAKALAGIHAVPVDPWPSPNDPQGPDFIDAEIAEYLADWKALGEDSPIIEACFDWILEHRELAYGPPTLTHNDFNFNNMLIEGSRVTAVLDWEFVHVGTMASDLGYFYYSAENVGSFEQFLNSYAKAGGKVPPKDQLDFYILWGQLRLGVMGYQATREFEQGKFDSIRYGTSVWHRRQALLRLAALMERLNTKG